MNILVFGKDGQLGKAFHVLLGSLLPTLADETNIQYIGRAECDLVDAAALSSLLNQFQPSLIINASAYTAVDKAESEPELAFAVNATDADAAPAVTPVIVGACGTVVAVTPDEAEEAEDVPYGDVD